jgi:hypothetical protein
MKTSEIKYLLGIVENELNKNLVEVKHNLGEAATSRKRDTIIVRRLSSDVTKLHAAITHVQMANRNLNFKERKSRK